jgi:hypothetical protein
MGCSPAVGRGATMGRMQSPNLDAQRVEAARYALLRRLSLALRDQMVAHLHPIGVATQVMDRRLREVPPDVARIGDDMNKVRGFSRAATEVNLDVLTWIAPEPARQVPLAAGIAECLEMLRSPFSYRGFQLRQAGTSPTLVARAAVRTVLSATLFGLTDDAASPGEVTLESAGTVVQIELKPVAGTTAPTGLPPYRVLQWQEVEWLAVAEGVALSRSPGSARLQFGA